MGLQWIADTPPLWDQDKARLVGGAEEGIFDRRYRNMSVGELAPGSWWRVVDGEQTVGFGWLDVVWGDAEILLVSDPERRGQGLGSFILEHLAAEARRRGLNYLYNTVRPAHPHGEEVTAWLRKQGFTDSEDGSLIRSTAARPD